MTDTGGYDEVVGALAEAYGRFTTATTDLAPRAWLRATGAEGWCVADLVAHQLADAQRALVTLHTPAGTPADTDRVTYWRPFGAQGTSGPDSDGAVAGAWFPKRFAAAFGHRADALAGLWAETAAAAVHAAGSADPRATVATQGHVLPVPDFVATLVVEVTLHTLDLAVALPEAAPPAAGLPVVRQTLDGLLGEPLPLDWSDEDYARAGTGRRPLTDDERARLGPLLDRFPLLG